MEWKRLLLVLRILKKNWYSFAPLLGVLERDYSFHNLPIFFLRDFKKLSHSLVKDMVKEYDKVVFAYSFFTTQAPSVLKELKNLSKHISQLGKEKFVLIAGGPHPTGDVKSTLRMGFDIVALGTSEASFPKLIYNLQLDKPLYNTPGIAYFQNNEIIRTEKQDLPLDKFYSFSEKFDMFPPIEISRGCPHGCKYCQVSYSFGKKMHHRSVNIIKKHVEAYEKRFRERGRTDIRFISPNSLCYGSKDGLKSNPKAIEELLRTVKSLNKARVFFCSFPSEGRPENFDEELAGIISEYCDNKLVTIGGQSGSNRILKLMNRGHTIDDVYEAVEIAINNGLEVSVDFLLGFPSETRNDQYKTLEAIKHLFKKGKVKARLHYFIPLAGTPVAHSTPAPIDTEVLRDLYKLGRGGRIWGCLESQQDFSLGRRFNTS
ncbi:MAG: TIGR04013 family B12-binding domain/radical SAM domain-containing protein [Candidatus Jordarchaeum sp.]|uniref:TIGR04013 family B12-binding domain/radical SAM domain-containing protein n=1 Tax=Candidatus Jordarchaeum sp. TaxID=2823881 RepID=UPI00404A1B1F